MKCKFVEKVLLLVLFIGVLGCNSTKKVPQGALLLRKNDITVDDKKPKNAHIYGYLQQEPNSRILGIPLGLYIYNLADDKAEENYQKWLENHPKWHHFLSKFLSEKQTQRLGKSFLISGKDRMLQQMGQAPVLLDTLLTHKSSQTLKAYFNSIGYFNSKTHYDILPLEKEKQVAVIHTIDKGMQYHIDTLSTRILSPEVDSL